MKRNLSLVVLACEIAAIIILHAVKMNQEAVPPSLEIKSVVSKAAMNNQETRHYTLVSLK